MSYANRPTDPVAIGERIREMREKRGYGQAELADLVGVRGQSMWRYEAGRQIPEGPVMERLAEVLGVTTRWIRYGDEPAAAGS